MEVRLDGGAKRRVSFSEQDKDQCGCGISSLKAAPQKKGEEADNLII
jgi:hypothetical protein